MASDICDRIEVSVTYSAISDREDNIMLTWFPSLKCEGLERGGAAQCSIAMGNYWHWKSRLAPAGIMAANLPLGRVLLIL